MRWIIDHLLWDTNGKAAAGWRERLWAARKVLLAVLGAGLLTWREWVEHHPPEILLVALIHFALVLAVIALVVYVGGRFTRQR